MINISVSLICVHNTLNARFWSVQKKLR